MIKCSNKTQQIYEEKVEAVAQKYFNDFILGERNYRWDIGNEMKKVGFGRR